jgi:anhydro-N-acetylmuramic acid kinase
MSKIYYALGLMSGSSLDGLDIAYCRIEWADEEVKDWELLAAATMPYSEMWQARLAALPGQNALAFAKTDTYFAYYMGELVNAFIQKEEIERVDYIASHGHTIFHEPDRRYSTQIGKGSALAAITEKTVIADFRSHDVALNGEGAPLAPLADAYLFAGYTYYLNIGGIANISAPMEDGRWAAFDVAPANQVLNFLTKEIGMPYDLGGQLAAKGQVQTDLLTQLRAEDYYQQKYPKSLGNAWIRQNVWPLLTESPISLEDRLATVVELIALEVAASVEQLGQKGSMLVTGGGAFNDFLIKRLKAHLQSLQVKVVLPEREIIDFKEALLMALLGLLRLEGLPNSWPEVTGAKRPTINGGIYV